MVRKKPVTAAKQPLAAPHPSFRSGAVARMAQMPVSTLRIWEQRYQAVGPSTAASGQRLYSAADVQRVLLLRQLTEQGHAIGAMAALDAAQLQQVASTQAASTTGQRVQPARRRATLRVAVVGQALALRIQRPAVVQCLAHRWQVTAVFESLDEAARAPAGPAIDLLLWQAPGLPHNAIPELNSAQGVLRARHVAVAYRFAGAAAKRALAGSGAVVVREPTDDDALGAWLASLEGPLVAKPDEPDGQPTPLSSPGLTPDLTPGHVTPRRFDDLALTTFAGLASTIACECPRHVAELLMQLSNFEAYSADCINRSPADAELHAYLQRVAGVSRALFEAALERVAREEGLMLP